MAYGSGSVNANPMYTSPLHIKQEIQIPQVTSMTSSPDSSPSPVQLPQHMPASGSGQQHSGGSNSGSTGMLAQQMEQNPSGGGVGWQISTSLNNTNSGKVKNCKINVCAEKFVKREN